MKHVRPRYFWVDGTIKVRRDFRFRDLRHAWASWHRRAGTPCDERKALHGLRRSFKSLTEWLEIPAGVVAKIMGHKPSATAEKNYTLRLLDLLRLHHEKIAVWVLVQAGIVFDANAALGTLRMVAG